MLAYIIKYSLNLINYFTIFKTRVTTCTHIFDLRTQTKLFFNLK